jgi:hypothetical protein
VSSGFQISAAQRRRLLEGDYKALQFAIKPSGCEPGARYVLAYQAASATVCEDGFVARTPRRPVWWITVTKVEDDPIRRPDARWLVRFDVTDLRDRDLFLRRGGGYEQGRDVLQAGRVPDPEWLDSEAEAIGEHWELERLKVVEREGQARSRARRQRAA